MVDRLYMLEGPQQYRHGGTVSSRACQKVTLALRKACFCMAELSHKSARPAELRGGDSFQTPQAAARNLSESCARLSLFALLHSTPSLVFLSSADISKSEPPCRRHRLRLCEPSPVGSLPYVRLFSSSYSACTDVKPFTVECQQQPRPKLLHS